MTIRVIASVLIMFTISLLTVLARRNPRWHAIQIGQLALGLGASIVAFHRESVLWLAIGFGIVSVFVFIPRLLQSASTRWRLQERWFDAARAERIAGLMIGGPSGRLARALGQVLRAMGHDDLGRADHLLDSLLARPLSLAGRDEVQFLKLSILLQRRQWARAVEYFSNLESWGSLASATRARLRIARAYAELGEMNRALRCLEFVALAPQGGTLEHEYWPTRLRLAAMAGDPAEVETILMRRSFARRSFVRVATYWRGRCALALGDGATAVKLLTRAYTLTHPGDRFWREAIQHYLARAEARPNESATPAPAASLPDYALQIEGLRQAERTAAPWRVLVTPSPPGIATIVLFTLISLVFTIQICLPVWSEVHLLARLANARATVSAGEWWRAFTTMFLHADFLHFVMNGAALWMFGSVVERAAGWWRMLLIFFLAGGMANAISASFAKYDYAIGASAGIFGLVGAYAVLLYRVRHPLFLTARRRMLLFLGLVVTGDFIFGALEPLIDDVAHMGGFVAGIVLTLLVGPRRQSLGHQTSPHL